MSILDQLKKINPWALVAVCTVLGLSLGAGSLTLSAFEGKKQPIRVDSSGIVAQTEPAGVGRVVGTSQSTKSATSQGQQRVVASKSGTKYHLLTCPGAKTILEKNRIYFESPAAAKKAGLTPASTCKGLTAP